MGPNEILLHCFLEHQRLMILSEEHVGATGGHYPGKAIVCKILQSRLWWPSMHAYA